MSFSAARPDVLVLGGGIIGLSVAWRLAKAGTRVTLLERGRLGSEASWAAAGMLAPLGEAKRPGPFLDLAVASLRMYPAWLESLAEESGHDVRLSSRGTLRVAMTEDESAAQPDLLEWQRATGLPIETLDGDEARTLEPHLSQQIRSALLSPEERQVDPRALLPALAEAVRRRGVTVIEEAAVTGFAIERERVLHVKTRAADYVCGEVVVATGAWSEAIGSMLGIRLPVTPVRGQVVSLRTEAPLLRHTIYSTGGYLVPREGCVLVGATQESAGFAAIPTVEGVQYLLALASDRVPVLKGAAFDSAWAGLRPGTPDDLPLLGPLQSLQNVHLATGHFRNGILLAPITAAIIEGSLVKSALPVSPEFAPERFHVAHELSESA